MPKSTTKLNFSFKKSKRVTATFDAKPLSTDGGVLLLRDAEQRVGLVAPMAVAVCDRRDSRYIGHSIDDLLRQRIFQIALGYEDCNDARTLRFDPALKVACGRGVTGEDLASQPTLSRLETSVDSKTCYRLAAAQVDHYIDRQPRRPARIVLDIDHTNDDVHGMQQLRFFHAYYDEYIYLPFLIFDEHGDLITTVLQPGKPDGGRCARSVIKRLVRRLRRQWPGIQIIVRGDAGFAGQNMYSLCEKLRVDYLLGITKNKRLEQRVDKLSRRVAGRYVRDATKHRAFTSFSYKAKSWNRRRRIIAKVEWSDQGQNLRFLVTSLQGRADHLYKEYDMRGEASENSIKDLKTALKADRLSCSRFLSNQFRLFLHAAAYVLLYTIRRAAVGTELENAQMDTLRLRLLKIAVQVDESVRRIWFHLTSSYPWQHLWIRIARQLRRPAPA